MSSPKGHSRLRQAKFRSAVSPAIWARGMARSTNPFRYFSSSSEVIRLAAMKG
jgi:hypothetical protein